MIPPKSPKQMVKQIQPKKMPFMPWMSRKVDENFPPMAPFVTVTTLVLDPLDPNKQGISWIDFYTELKKRIPIFIQ
jgi:hypothetical protein